MPPGGLAPRLRPASLPGIPFASAVTLLLKNALFTLLLPGIFVFWLPLEVFVRHAAWPDQLELHHGAALTIAALGVGAYLHCVWLFMRRGRGTPFPLDPPRHLVRRGLYAWVRNPIYLGILLIVAAEALFLRSVDVLLYWVCLACFLQVFVRIHEERDLAMRFGAMYEDYRREVPRWFPRPPRSPPPRSGGTRD